MALSNLFGWNKKAEATPAAACGAGDKPTESLPRSLPLAALPAVLRTSPLKSPLSACGAGDKQ